MLPATRQLFLEKQRTPDPRSQFLVTYFCFFEVLCFILFSIFVGSIFISFVLFSVDSTEKKSSWRSKKWDYFERLRKSQKSNYDGARVHSRSIQDQLPFPKPFPLTNLTYGLRALQMISTGVVTRPGKMQFLDTVFNEIVKYTGLYVYTGGSFHVYHYIFSWMIRTKYPQNVYT